jgi:hypothetical protein
MKSLRLSLFLGLLSAVLPAGCDRRPGPSPAAADAGSVVLASVGGQTVTEAEFRRRWQGQPPTADTDAARQQVLDELIVRAALTATARRDGLERDPEIADEIERLLVARLREKRLQPQLDALSVPEDVLKAYYEQHRKTRFLEAERIRVAVLWFDTHGQPPLVARFQPRLESVRAQLLAAPAAFPIAEGFGGLAVTNSEHRVSRFKGGDVGWLSAPAGGVAAIGWETAVLGVAQTLRAPGDLSEVVETPEGLLLVRMIERRPGGIAAYASVRDRIARTLSQELREQKEAQFKRDVLSQVSIQRYPAVLSALKDLRPPALMGATGEAHPPKLIPTP